MCDMESGRSESHQEHMKATSFVIEFNDSTNLLTGLQDAFAMYRKKRQVNVLCIKNVLQ